MKTFWKLIVIASILAIPSVGLSQEPIEEKLYNFDDMLIDGSYRDPQGMFERSRAELSFEGVLKLKRSFILEIEVNAQETAMQP